jgi:hypothetical protein
MMDPEGDQDDEVLRPPTAERVARRALAMCAVVCRGFLEADAGDAGAEDFRQRVIRWLDDVNVSAELEEHERELLHTPLGGVDQRAVINATWLAEGLAVLAWALGTMDLPPYDDSVDPAEVADTLGFMGDQAREVIQSALVDAEAIEAFQSSILTAHWRLRQYGLQPEKLDFTAFVKTAWFGPLSLDGLRLVDGDLAIGDEPISQASEEACSHCQSIVQERHRAANWLAGWGEPYSEVDTST